MDVISHFYFSLDYLEEKLGQKSNFNVRIEMLRARRTLPSCTE